MTSRRRGVGTAVAAAAALLLAGCGLSVPTDPEGTLDRVSGGILRVGATTNGEWVAVRTGAEPVGVEVDLVETFADELGAEPRWSTGSEHDLVDDLEHGELDLVIGGFPDDTPWVNRASMTTPYAEGRDERGDPISRVMLVRRGENAFLLELDRFLQNRPEVNR